MELKKAKEILEKHSKKKYTEKELTELMELLNYIKEVYLSNITNYQKHEKRNSLC